MSLFKDFTKNLGGIIADSALNGLVQGIRASEFIGRYGGVLGDERATYITDGGQNVSESVEQDNNIFSQLKNSYYDSFTNSVSLSANHEKYIEANNKKLKGVATNIDQDREFNIDDNLTESDKYVLRLPQWGYDDFINERNIFIKNFSTGFGDPGWMYFKVFFKFNTQHGLFGGLLNHANPELTLNGAYSYLSQCSGRYKTAKLGDKATALRKFTNLLSYINSYSPWFFKSIKNLSNAGNPYISDFTSDNKSFELELAEDAIDMRISTLFSLYKFACFDDINCREIIPDNLRKFDMCVVIFSSPLKLQHTPLEGFSNSEIFKTHKKNKYKNLYDNDTQNLMSFKLFNFLNCEFDKSTLGGTIPGDLTNDNPFQLGKNTIKINYDRMYEYTNNEFTGDLFGSDAYYFTGSKVVTVNTSYQNMVVASEEFINNNIKNLLGRHQNYALGNLFWQDRGLYKSYTNKTIDKEGSGSKFLTDFAKAKYGLMKGNSNFITSLGYDTIYKLLGSSYKYGSAPGIDGSGTVLNGEGQLGVGSAIWQRKMNKIKYGPQGTSWREARLNAEYTATNFDMQKYIKNKAAKSVKSII